MRLAASLWAPFWTIAALFLGNVATAQMAGEDRLNADWMRQARADSGSAAVKFDKLAETAIKRGRALGADLANAGVDVRQALGQLDAVADHCKSQLSPQDQTAAYLQARRAVRSLAMLNPALDFDRLIFVTRKPGTFNHMSDQYYSWWSRPGGGVCILEGVKSDQPRIRCLTESLPTGSFLAPDLSYDGKKILFAYCRYYPDRAGVRDKVNKDAQPEDSFYHIFEIGVDGSGLRQITHGRYDDTFARYLPDGNIIFLSTRRGQAIQCGKESAESSLNTTLPDSFVRCGGDAWRPVSIYTLHSMDRDGGNMQALSAFESFEWDPNVADDGRVLYSRWDYIDRDNMPYMKVWSCLPDGANPQIFFGNFTKNPFSIFETRSIPGSRKVVATASAHHAITAGSLILIDPDRGIQDGLEPITRLTPEVPFPESEAWPVTYYANPYPLSERYFLVAWSDQRLAHEGQKPNEENATGLYLYDSFGNRELLYRDEQIGSAYPIPLRPRQKPLAVASASPANATPEGRFLLQDVYAGLDNVPAGSIKSLRIIAMPIKTQPNMNSPSLGVTHDDPGKCVLGTVPVEADGSAYFRVPSGVAVFFQALDDQNRAIQTMRSLTYVQPGQTLACVGCHEQRNMAPPHGESRLLALARPASQLTPGPEGSWPLRFDQLVQPILDSQCVSCHGKDAKDAAAAKFDLAPAKAYETLLHFGKPSLFDQVRKAYYQGYSRADDGGARHCALMALLTAPGGHHGVTLDRPSLARLSLWIDLYAQKQGMFSPEQEKQLIEFRQRISGLLLSSAKGN